MIKGSKHTPATRRKIAKKMTRYPVAELITGVELYTILIEKKVKDIPTIAGLSVFLGCSRQLLYNKMEKSTKLMKLLDTLNDIAEDRIIQGGLNESFNSGFAQFLLKAKHGYKTEQSNQNIMNTYNITPELLKEADRL